MKDTQPRVKDEKKSKHAARQQLVRVLIPRPQFVLLVVHISASFFKIK